MYLNTLLVINNFYFETELGREVSNFFCFLLKKKKIGGGLGWGPVSQIVT